jgi:hypothetical protein
MAGMVLPSLHILEPCIMTRVLLLSDYCILEHTTYMRIKQNKIPFENVLSNHFET